jgi:hypothetical protein
MQADISTDVKKEEEEEEQKAVRCKNCGYDITSPSLAIQPHEHTFRNPAGYSFHVLRYSDAEGAADVGECTTEASWFAGYAWSFALCRRCQTHLGWWYTGTGRFVGLIAQRLIR